MKTKTIVISLVLSLFLIGLVYAVGTGVGGNSTCKLTRAQDTILKANGITNLKHSDTNCDGKYCYSYIYNPDKTFNKLVSMADLNDESTQTTNRNDVSCRILGEYADYLTSKQNPKPPISGGDVEITTGVTP
jgi:hypothetical protein